MANLNLSQEKLAALRSEYKHRNKNGKYPRQKMLPEYRCIYPWVLPDETDPYFTFCTVCECRLSAKRSDLGKHEGSIKHTENAMKKGLMNNANESARVMEDKDNQAPPHIRLESSDSAAEITVSDDEDDDDDNDDEEEEEVEENKAENNDVIYVKQEPVVDIIESSSNNPLNFDMFNARNNDSQDSEFHLPKQSVDENEESDIDDDEDDDDDDDNENGEGADDCATQPPTKRFAASLSSQSMNPTNINIKTSETAMQRNFSIRKVVNHSDDSKPALHLPVQTPCKITIKKITTPITTVAQAGAIVNPIAATTITPVPIASTALNITKQQSPMLPGITTPPVTSLTSSLMPATATPLPRDSFDLFFDSICATVKSLPPKLATEGKVRVMQLIGELEIRAITERELSQSQSVTGQQNSTVASTTK